jgi:hypothetical protein
MNVPSRVMLKAGDPSGTTLWNNVIRGGVLLNSWVYKGWLYPLDLVIFKYNKSKVYNMDQTLSIRIVKLQEIF